MVHRHVHRDHGATLERRNPENNDAGKVNVVYVPALATFDGNTKDLLTDEHATATNKPAVGVGPAVQNSNSKDSEQTEEPKSQQTTQQPETHTTKNEQPTKTEHTATQTNAATTDNKPTGQTTLATATPNATADNTRAHNTNTGMNRISATSSSDKSSVSPSTTSAADSGALSGGAKAGIAIGVIVGVGLIAGLIFFLLRKRKQNQKLREDEDEKEFGNHGPLPPPASPPMSEPRTPAEPPQLNVRPITQFAPFGVGTFGDFTTKNTEDAPAGSTATAPGNRSPPHTPLSNTSNGNPFGDPANPFDNRTEPSSPGVPSPVSPSVVSIPEGPGPTLPVSDSEGTIAETATAGAAGAAVGATATHKSKPSEEKLPTTSEFGTVRSEPPTPQGPTPPNANRALTPEHNSSGVPAAAPVVAPVGTTSPSPGPGPLNIHRVQMDFNHSMEDELTLRVGQLVRLVHEFDDGWALCVRLDRSQQGVAPRSCLSSRPVQPRSRPPPGGAPGSRGPPMTGPNGRMPTQSPRFYPPQDARPSSPARPGYAVPPYPQRPMPPGQFPSTPRSFSPGPGARPMPPRSMSPGPYGAPGMQRPQMAASQRPRSGSVGDALGPNPRIGAQPGPSSLATPMMPPSSGIPRKPVPGNANLI